MDIYNDINPEAPLDEAGFIAKLQQKYPMKHVAYDYDSATQTIGIPFPDALDGEELLPTLETMGNLYIMPNDDSNPTGSIAFTTINTGVNEYKWVNLGAVDIPDNALTKEMVDNECINGTIDTPASAKAVMELKSKLGSIDLTETKVAVETDGAGQNVTSGYFVDGSTGENARPSSSSDYQYYDVFETLLQEGTKSVRFCAGGRKNSTYKSGYAFGKYVSDTWTPIVYGYFPVSDYESDMLLPVPDDATHFRTTCKAKSSVAQMDLDKFYCYLQSGESVVDLIPKIDDTQLDNPSEETVPKAIDVKPLKDKLSDVSFYEDKAEYDNIITGKITTTGEIITEGFGTKIAIIDVVGYKKVRFLGMCTYSNPSPTWGFAFYKSETPSIENVLKSYTIDANQGTYTKEYILDVPSDAVTFAFVCKNDSWSTDLWNNTYCYLQAGSSISDMIEDSSDDIMEDVNELKSKFISVTKIDMASLKKTLCYINSSKVWKAGVIDSKSGHSVIHVSPGEIYTITANQNKNAEVAFLTDGYDDIYGGDTPTPDTDAPVLEGTSMMYVTKGTKQQFVIPEGCKYLYFFKGGSTETYKPQEITKIVEKSLNTEMSLDKMLRGYISNEGEFIEDTHYVTTQLIQGNFHVKLYPGYQIYRVVVYDRNRNMCNYNYVIPSRPSRVMFDGSSTGNYADLAWEDCGRTEFGSLGIPDGFGCRIIIARDNTTETITPNDKIIRTLSYLDQEEYRSSLDVNDEKIRPIIQRIINISAIYWMCNAELPIKSYNYPNANLPGQTSLGIPYSLVRERGKFVGYGCNMKTFVSSLKNKKSLMYSEDLRNLSSGYGLYYANIGGLKGNSATFYGTVCSGLANYIFGIPMPYKCGSMLAHDEYEQVQGDAYNLPPLVAIQQQDHVFVIVDFLYDKYGKRRFAVVAEEITPCSKLYVYTVEALQFRLNYLKRYWELKDDTPGIPRYLKLKDEYYETYKSSLVDQYYIFDENEYDYNDFEIMTFAGDYASFPLYLNDCGDENYIDPIYLNAIPSDKYDKVVIERKAPNENSYSIVDDIDISEYVADDDGYIDIEITSIVNGAGLYRARLENSEDEDVFSKYTHWEAVALNADVTKGSSQNSWLQINLNSYSGGTPLGTCLMLEWQPWGDHYSARFSDDYDAYHIITQQEINSGEIRYDASHFSNSPWSKISTVVIMKGEYSQVQFNLKM